MTPNTNAAHGESKPARQGAPLLSIFLLVAVLALLMASGFTGQTFREQQGNQSDLLEWLAFLIALIACPGIATGFVLGLVSKRKSATVPAGLVLGLVFGVMCGVAIV